MKTLYQDQFDSPIGTILFLADPDTHALVYLDFADNPDRMMKILNMRYGAIELIAHALTDIHLKLEAYFKGQLRALEEIKTDLGGTAFQQMVWRSLKTIPPGEILSYQGLAEQIENPRAVRAVARANALNPLSLIYPCHRVIGSDGQLRGYAGGLARKDWLLRHEGVEDTWN